MVHESPVLESRSLAEQVAQNIEQMIISNQYGPGEKLPNEYEFATQLNVGRSTIREAIKLLESRNVLKIIRGSGTFVSKRPGQMDDPFGFRFVSDKKRLALDLCEIRANIEPYLAERAARFASLDDVSLLQKKCDEVAYYIRQGSKEYGKLDIEFHTRIAICSGNKISIKLIPVIHQGIAAYTELTDPKLAIRAPITHQAIVDAIKERNPERARAAMEEHLRDNMEILLNV